MTKELQLYNQSYQLGMDLRLDRCKIQVLADIPGQRLPLAISTTSFLNTLLCTIHIRCPAVTLNVLRAAIPYHFRALQGFQMLAGASAVSQGSQQMDLTAPDPVSTKHKQTMPTDFHIQGNRYTHRMENKYREALFGNW